MTKTPTPSLPMPSLQDGLDNIWRFQLRKENAVLLEAQETQQKILQTLANQSAKLKSEFEERYLALELRLSDLENDERKDRHAFETWHQEMATLKAQMGIMMEKQEEQVSEAQAAAFTMNRPTSRMSTTDSTDIPTSSSHAAMTVTTNKAPTHQPMSIRTPKTNVASLTRVPATNTALQSNRSTDKVIDVTGPTTCSRSRSRSGSVPFEPAPTYILSNPDQTPSPAPRPKIKATVAAPIVALTPSQPTKISRLHQGHSSLKVYLEKATRIWNSLPNPKDQKVEIEFIALFIKGIENGNKRETLVSELQQQHQSRTKRDGKVEILCKWNDVGQGMKDAELIKG